MHDEEYQRFLRQLPIKIRNELDSDYGFQRKLLYQEYLDEKIRLEMGSKKQRDEEVLSDVDHEESYDELEYANMDDLAAYKTRVKSKVRKLKRDKKFEQAFSF